jgi:hypothetical protein
MKKFVNKSKENICTPCTAYFTPKFDISFKDIHIFCYGKPQWFMVGICSVNTHISKDVWHTAERTKNGKSYRQY